MVAVATEEFVQAADAQSQALGVTPAWVWVPHPIQDRTDAELQAMADRHFEAILAALTQQES